MTDAQEILMRAIGGTIPELKQMILEIMRELAGTEVHDEQVHRLHVRGAIIAIGNARFGGAWQL